MVYNLSTGLFEYNRTFAVAGTYTYNVSCNDTGHNLTETSDDVWLGDCILLNDNLFMNNDGNMLQQL